MQPVLPPWITFVSTLLAPASALIGVVVGGLLQRRTSQAVTQVQLEAARVRDRELWGREDRHRFLSEKRALYASLLVEVEEYRQRLVKRRGLFLKLQVEVSNEQNLLKEEWRRHVAAAGLDLSSTRKRVQQLLSEIELVSPGRVVAKTEALWNCIIIDTSTAVDHDEWSFGEAFHEFEDNIESAREAMRTDLAIEE